MLGRHSRGSILPLATDGTRPRPYRGSEFTDLFSILAEENRLFRYSLMMQREPAGLGEAWRQRGLH